MVWARIKAPDFLKDMDGLETNRINQLMVTQMLQTTHDPNVFAFGDCASCPWPEKNGWIPPRAQSAHQQASHLYKQLPRRQHGEALRPFVYRDFGSLVSLGKFSTVGSLMGAITRGSVMVEGYFAKIMYLSLYKMHELALHGFTKVFLDTLARIITRRPSRTSSALVSAMRSGRVEQCWLWGAVTVTVAACSSLPYSPRPLNPESVAPEYAQRSGNADGLKRFAVANGYSESAWPPGEWELRELTLASLYFHSDMRIARARAQVARAELSSVKQPQALSARVKPEYHSRTLPEDSGPWSLGLELEIPLVAQGKRAARPSAVHSRDAAEVHCAAGEGCARGYATGCSFSGPPGNLELSAHAGTQGMRALVGAPVERVLLSARDLGAERVAVRNSRARG